MSNTRQDLIGLYKRNMFVKPKSTDFLTVGVDNNTNVRVGESTNPETRLVRISELRAVLGIEKGNVKLNKLKDVLADCNDFESFKEAILQIPE